MKKYIIVILALLAGVSCSNDTNDCCNPGDLPTIAGKWSLVNVSGGLLGVDQDFKKGAITWDFNESTKMVTIVNNNTIKDVYDGLPSGTYTYNISAPADADMLVVNDIDLGLINITINSFTLNESALDGITVTFER